VPWAKESGPVVAVALAARLGVVAWASGRFPPAADGAYYETVARRISEGHGYTWLWPDGAVTYAAHYPVGYPAMLGLAFFLFGAHPGVAMAWNALLGALGTGAAHQIALRSMPVRSALVAALVVALHPALLPYTAAIMTEGVTGSLLLLAVALAAAARDGERPTLFRLAAGITMGVATLVRPQCLALAPVVGLLSIRSAIGSSSWRPRLLAAFAVLGLTVLVCLPWTLRNCQRMDRCALVSVNGGWNLLIGAETETGGWTEVLVPEACREVWSEAGKDTCFESEGRHLIAGHPLAWLARVPKKLAQTFDYVGAAPWYLHLSNGDAFNDRAKLTLGSMETLITRLLLVFALANLARLPGPPRTLRWAIAAVGLLFAVLVHAWVAYLALAVLALVRGPRASQEDPIVLPFTAALILLTAITHATFFGAGRYLLPVLPFVAILAAFGARAGAGRTRVSGSTLR
jgi:4-amino-4-deoxy-L-arabinose transferase-like glycosyltransferase